MFGHSLTFYVYIYYILSSGLDEHTLMIEQPCEIVRQIMFYLTALLIVCEEYWIVLCDQDIPSVQAMIIIFFHYSVQQLQVKTSPQMLASVPRSLLRH